jgi:hypothetical protein
VSRSASSSITGTSEKRHGRTQDAPSSPDVATTDTPSTLIPLQQNAIIPTIPVATELAYTQVGANPSTLSVQLPRNTATESDSSGSSAFSPVGIQSGLRTFGAASQKTRTTGSDINVQTGANQRTNAFTYSPVNTKNAVISSVTKAQAIPDAGITNNRAEMYAASPVENKTALTDKAFLPQPNRSTPLSDPTNSLSALSQPQNPGAEATPVSVTPVQVQTADESELSPVPVAGSPALPTASFVPITKPDQLSNKLTDAPEATPNNAVPKPLAPTKQSQTAVDPNASTTRAQISSFIASAKPSAPVATPTNTRPAVAPGPKANLSKSPSMETPSSIQSVEPNSVARPLVSSVPASIPSKESPAPFSQEADVQPEATSENASSASAVPFVAAPVVAGQPPAPFVQDSEIQSAIFGAIESNSSYSGSLKDSVLGRSTAQATDAPTQPNAKTATSDKKFRVAPQKGARESDQDNSAQSSSHSAVQIKQSAMLAKTENPVAQSSAQSAAPVAEAPTAAVRNTFVDHAPVAENPLDAQRPDDSVYSQPETNVTSPLNSVQTAHLVQQLSETELRVGIQSGQFGKIDIHTSISQSQISARIYVEHDELGKAMAGALPQLHEKLAVEHRLDAQIELYNSGSSHSSGADRQQHQQQRTPEQDGPASRDADVTKPHVENVPEPVSTAAIIGLDMHV